MAAACVDWQSYRLSLTGRTQTSFLFLCFNKFLISHVHILTDPYICSGYPLTKFTIRPFSDSDLTNDPDEAKRRRDWNRRLSKLQIAIEHAFGMLKGRFPSLRDMPGVDLDRIFKTIEALMVIHNILVEMDDDPAEIDGYNGHEDLGLFGPARNGQDEVAARRAREVDRFGDEHLH